MDCLLSSSPLPPPPPTTRTPRALLLPPSIFHSHDDVIKWKRFPRYWPFVRGIHRSLVNSPHKSQWRGALMFSLICVWINGWVNNGEAGDLRRYRSHYDVTVILSGYGTAILFTTFEMSWLNRRPFNSLFNNFHRLAKQYSSELLALCEGNPLVTDEFIS